jgi:tetratricopeptide (TPR) repeat protein
MQGELAQAIIKMEQARSVKPLDAGLLINLGKAYFDSGNYLKSIQIYEIYKNNFSSNPEIDLGIVIANEKIGNLQLALDSCMQITKNFHEYTEAWKELNVIYIKLKRWGESKTAALKALEIAPLDPEAWIALGNSLYQLGAYEAAIKANEKALEVGPESGLPWTNIGNCYLRMGIADKAIESHLLSVELGPDSEDAIYNLGVAYGQIGEFKSAIDFYEVLLKLNPQHNQAKFNKGLSLLQLGDFDHGWSLYEHRWDLVDAFQVRHAQIQRLYSLDGIENKKILVWHEQGLGDTIQFCRFVPQLIKLRAVVTFEVQKPLVKLLKNTLNCEVIENVKEGEKFDFQIPLLSLPLLFHVNLKNIPPTIFLQAETSKAEVWRGRLDLSNFKLNIGIAISGNSSHRNDHNRSMPLHFIKLLLNYAKVFVLQKEMGAQDRSFLEENSEIVFLGSEIDDFSDTAAIIHSLDLIISVDTSLVHLAGALNKKTLLLLSHIPEWRWLWERHDTPWYETISPIIQETDGDWDGVMSKVVNHVGFLAFGTLLPD